MNRLPSSWASPRPDLSCEISLHLFHLCGTEDDSRYQGLAISNGDRQFQFLESIINTAISADHRFLSHGILKALNFHAIACLHSFAGEYRPCEVHVPDGQGGVALNGVPSFDVQTHMDQFLNFTNSVWDRADPVELGALILWNICRIHPFVNGNGRTARAACYFAICVKLNGMLPGTTMLPPLLKAHPDYVSALRHADATAAAWQVDLSPLCTVIGDCLTQQVGP